MFWSRKKAPNDTDRLFTTITQYGRIAAQTSLDDSESGNKILVFSLFDTLYALAIDADYHPIEIGTVISVYIHKDGRCSLKAIKISGFHPMNVFEREDMSKETYNRFTYWVSTFLKVAPEKGIVLCGEYNVRVFTE